MQKSRSKSKEEPEDFHLRPGEFGIATTIESIPIEKLKGVGKKTAERLASRGILNVADLLLVFPRRYKFFEPGLDGQRAKKDRIGSVALVGTIERVIEPGPRSRKPVEVVVQCQGAFFTLLWFNMNKPWFVKKFVIGADISFFGDVEYRDMPQLYHPEFVLNSKLPMKSGLDPVYPGIEGVAPKTFRKFIKAAWDLISESIVDLLPDDIYKKHQLIPAKQALQIIHGFIDYSDYAKFEADLDSAIYRLVYEECFTLQNALAKRYIKERRVSDAPKFSDHSRAMRFLDGLPFTLTEEQSRVTKELFEELSSGMRMRRLLQGDVGSGKTIVAFSMAVAAAENGFQTALMVPSEVLAQQHFSTAKKLLSETGIRIELLTGSVSAQHKRDVLKALKHGYIDLIVGTHSLFQKDIEFADDGKKLGLLIIDEQHKFGVDQKAMLEEKGSSPHFLAMTATPIPRSLAHALFGDLDLTYLNERPPGRQTIRTFYRTEEKAEKVYQYVHDQCSDGARAFVVFPSINGLNHPMLGVEPGSELLANGSLAGLKIGVLHGKMKTDERQIVMEKFRKGSIDVLCATTVIEVGVDVPEATLIVIEGAERFGLSQLHQLRGRVGRGDKPSMCILMSRTPLNDFTVQRLDAFVATDSGFELSDIDLQFRGAGEFLGQRQSGMGEFRVANLIRDAATMIEARRDARFLLFGGE